MKETWIRNKHGGRSCCDDAAGRPIILCCRCHSGQIYLLDSVVEHKPLKVWISRLKAVLERALLFPRGHTDEVALWWCSPTCQTSDDEENLCSCNTAIICSYCPLISSVSRAASWTSRGCKIRALFNMNSVCESAQTQSDDPEMFSSVSVCFHRRHHQSDQTRFSFSLV